MRLVFVAILALLWLATPGTAQTASPGESSQVLACFYECKPGPSVQGNPTFSEVTTLMITNQGRAAEDVGLVYLDGNENIIARSTLNLSSLDLDEVSVCHTLADGLGVDPPKAGLVEIVSPQVSAGESGLRAWVKNPVGKFFASNPEVFEGRVTGIGKTKCELIPDPQINSADEISTLAASASVIPAILIEDTGEVPALCSGPTGSACGNPGIGICIQGKCMVEVNMAAGDTGNSVCSQIGLTCSSVPVLSPAFEACLAFNPGATTSSDFNGWAEAVHCTNNQGLACANRPNDCHVCPACTVGNLTCGTGGSVLLSDLYAECV